MRMLSLSMLAGCAIAAAMPHPATAFDPMLNNGASAHMQRGTAPRESARPGETFFAKGVTAVRKNDYEFAVNMYEVSASWAYKPAQYNLAVMYAKGEGVPIDKPRAMAWAALAAERGDQDYVDARELIYADLTKDEFAKANEIWRDLKKTYADDIALERAKTRWAQVKAGITGSRVGGIGNLKVGAESSGGKLTYIGPNGRSALDGNQFSGASVLTGGSIDGAVAYKQLRESANPYDPKFKQPIGTATVEPIMPMPDDKGEAPAPNDQHPRNT